MHNRRIGKSDLFVNPIGLGCMSIGTDTPHAVRTVQTAFESGVNFFDTADLYEQGMNEDLVGQALKAFRSDVILATKVGNRFQPGTPGWTWDPSPSHITLGVEASLRRLGTDVIDLYQLHGGTIDDPIDDIIDTFERLKDRGLIRYYGISSIRPNVIQQYLMRSNIVSVMMQYSVLDRRPEEWFPDLDTAGVSIIARGPLASGILTSRAREERIEQGYLDYSPAELQSLRTRMQNRKRSMEELAFGYVLAESSVSVVLPGASSSEQAAENVGAGNSSVLSAEEKEWLRSLTKPLQYTQHRT